MTPFFTSHQVVFTCFAFLANTSTAVLPRLDVLHLQVRGWMMQTSQESDKMQQQVGVFLGHCPARTCLFFPTKRSKLQLICWQVSCMKRPVARTKVGWIWPLLASRKMMVIVALEVTYDATMPWLIVQ
jgi:hypothetical protein